jgi:glycosyltransferase involved in cell wall biosynthesis
MSGHENIFLTVVFWIFAAATLIQFFYYLWFYLAVAIYKKSVENPVSQPVSVIICARNEAENLDKFLPFILEQKYPDYEVIVVNDCSEDNTYDILGKYLLKYPHLNVSTINKDPKFTHNKKLAQFIGIKAAKNELLLFTDADCRPESDKWLESMMRHFEAKTTFVLGYGGYFREKGLLNSFIRYDSMTIALQYIGMAIRGIPYMGVGRNLAYRRSLFFANKGYGAHNQLASGDDDLIVNGNATAENTKVEFSLNAHTRSVPAATVTEYIKQKRRHFTTAPHYRFKHKLLLILEPASRLLFYSTFIILLSCLFLWPYVLVIFGLRLIIQLVTLALAARRLNEQGMVAVSLFFDILSPLIFSTLYITKTGKKQGRSRWR